MNFPHLNVTRPEGAAAPNKAAGNARNEAVRDSAELRRAAMEF